MTLDPTKLAGVRSALEHLVVIVAMDDMQLATNLETMVNEGVEALCEEIERLRGILDEKDLFLAEDDAAFKDLDLNIANQAEQLLQAQSEAARWRALLGKVFDSRAPDYVDQAYPGWSTEARSALSTQTQGGGENG